MTAPTAPYAARLDIDYPEQLDRLSTAFRFIWIIPIAIVLGALSAAATSSVTVITDTGQVVTQVSRTGGGIAGGLFAATLLMVLFRRRYPRWWFDFALQFNRFGARVAAYGALLTDRYPSTVEEQSVHLELDDPDAERDLNRWLPLVKWLLVIPHIVVLARSGRATARPRCCAAPEPNPAPRTTRANAPGSSRCHRRRSAGGFASGPAPSPGRR